MDRASPGTNEWNPGGNRTIFPTTTAALRGTPFGLPFQGSIFLPMNSSCLAHCLTDAERTRFEEQGYLVIPEALPPDRIEALMHACDRLIAEKRRHHGFGPHDPVDIPDIIGQDPLFLELVDWETTFPKVWGILGWNICIYHSGLLMTPPGDPERPPSAATVAWHQDSMRVNDEIEATPRPRLSLKVFFFISDMSETGRRNTLIVPGSHLHDEIDVPGDGQSSPEGAIPLCVPPGASVIIDRRIWHSRSVNSWHETRKMLMMGLQLPLAAAQGQHDRRTPLPRSRPDPWGSCSATTRATTARMRRKREKPRCATGSRSTAPPMRRGRRETAPGSPSSRPCPGSRRLDNPPAGHPSPPSTWLERRKWKQQTAGTR